ncbi:hypothetical protein AKJ16_DCAP12072 [Drosera capensis]
MIGDSSRRRRA